MVSQPVKGRARSWWEKGRGQSKQTERYGWCMIEITYIIMLTFLKKMKNNNCPARHRVARAQKPTG